MINLLAETTITLDLLGVGSWGMIIGACLFFGSFLLLILGSGGEGGIVVGAIMVFPMIAGIIIFVVSLLIWIGGLVMNQQVEPDPQTTQTIGRYHDEQSYPRNRQHFESQLSQRWEVGRSCFEFNRHSG